MKQDAAWDRSVQAPEKLIKFRPLAFQVTGTRSGKPHPLHKGDPREVLNDCPWLGWLGFCVPHCQLLTRGPVSPPLHKLNRPAGPRAASGAGVFGKHMGHQPLSLMDMQTPETTGSGQTRRLRWRTYLLLRCMLLSFRKLTVSKSLSFRWASYCLFCFLSVHCVTSKEGLKWLWSPWACWSMRTPWRPETQFTGCRELPGKWNTPPLLRVCVYDKQRPEGSRKNVKFGS